MNNPLEQQPAQPTFQPTFQPVPPTKPIKPIKPNQPATNQPSDQNPNQPSNTYQTKQTDNIEGSTPIYFYPTSMTFDPKTVANMNTVSPNIFIKNYSINTGIMPGGDLTKLNMIYEDILPPQLASSSISTVNERVSLYGFIRTTMFTNNDGEDVPMDGSSNSILARTRHMEINPYTYNKFTANPFKGLPYGFLLFRHCYPIRFDQVAKNDVICAKQSVALNIRIYRLTDRIYSNGRIVADDKTMIDYDEWREVAFYEYVRERVIKKMISPNFVMMYGYNLPTKSQINFDVAFSATNLSDFKQKYSSNDTKYATTISNFPIITNQSKPMPQPLFVNPISIATTSTKINIANKPVIPTMPKMTPVGSSVDGPILAQLDEYTGKVLAIVTEAPSNNLFAWASLTYTMSGGKGTMTNQGYRKDNIWKSVLFQIMSAMYVMQIHGLTIEDFSFEKNVFVKEFNAPGTKCWKYVIDGIEYYVPDTGNFVLIDTNFRDFQELDIEHFTKNTKPAHKLDGVIFGMNKDIAKKKVFDLFVKCFTPNTFGQEFKNRGGAEIPDSIIKLLSDISKETDTKNISIGYYIQKFFNEYVNNRIGTLLKESELNNIIKHKDKPLKKGLMAVYESQYGEIKFCLIIKVGSITSVILTRNDEGNIIEENVENANISAYSRASQIEQTFKPFETILGEDEVQETYKIIDE